jgi:hypothetical protein
MVGVDSWVCVITQTGREELDDPERSRSEGGREEEEEPKCSRSEGGREEEEEPEHSLSGVERRR